MVRSYEVASDRSDFPVAGKTWEIEYAQGRWECMRYLDEFARYSMIAGYFQHIKPGGSILDVGCGEGILRERLAGGFGRYVGVDISRTAVGRLPQDDGKTAYAAADAARYVPDGSFDAIVFNETLYYFDEPLELLRRYEKFLGPEGIFITSLYSGSRRAVSIGRAMKREYALLHEVTIGTLAGKTWVCGVWAPLPR
jgi:2-polyprenyl-3-methyl-5-hydroxy-6-metoxy-1,4-benzoquinol methylase